MGLVNFLGDAAAARFTADDWAQHAGGHVLFGGIVLVIALTLSRMRRATMRGSWFHRSLTIARAFALLLSGTSFVEAAGAYPPLGILHIWWAVAPTLALLVLGLAGMAITGVVFLVGRRMKWLHVTA